MDGAVLPRSAFFLMNWLGTYLLVPIYFCVRSIFFQGLPGERDVVYTETITEAPMQARKP